MKIPILSVKDNDGNVIPIPAIQGQKGEPGGAQSVNGVPYNEQGNIPLTSTNIPHGETTVGAELNGLNDALGDKQDKLADYIVEQGTSGEWTYVKWKSGNSTAWISKVVTVSANEGNVTVPAPFTLNKPVILVTAGTTISAFTKPITAMRKGNDAIEVSYTSSAAITATLNLLVIDCIN